MARQLYTEANVRDMPRGSELVLGTDDLATPSALDVAFARNIRVCRADGGAAAAGAAPGPWERMLARDGTYVVEVQRGRATVHRLTPEGPVALASGADGEGR